MADDQPLGIDEEYKLWRENCPYMYDFVSETALKWPTLTVQWLPGYQLGAEGLEQSLLLGTHTSGEDTDYLKYASTTLPGRFVPGAAATGSPEPQTEEELSQQVARARLRVTRKFRADREINRARYMPQDPAKVATISGSGLVTIYNLDDKKDVVRLDFHQQNGYGISWNRFRHGILLSGADDAKVAIWDINKAQPETVLTHHTNIVNDVKWHEKNQNLFGSVSDDKQVLIHDDRNTSLKPMHSIVRNCPINTISFSNKSHNLFAIGLQDSNIELFDLRNPTTKLHTIMGHSDAVTTIEWDPHNDGILCSGSQDRRVILWDLKRIGEEQTQEDEDDGAPELFMMHAGHTSPITDISFNPIIPFTLATSSDDNIVQVWKVAKNICQTDLDELDDFDIYSLE